jgi:hypothetical protein
MPSSKGNISSIMRDFKKYTTKEIIQQLEVQKRFDTLDVFNRKAKKHHPQNNRVYQVWEDRFDDVVLYSGKVLKTKLDYIHHNPVKAGLVDNPCDYLYSSARNYNSGDHSIIQVDCEAIFGLVGAGIEVKDQVRSGT